MCGRYVFEYYHLCYPATRHVDHSKLGQVSLVRYTNDRYSCRFCKRLILGNAPPIASVHRADDQVTVWVGVVHQLNIEVNLQWVMCQRVQYTFQNLAAVYCFQDMWMILNPTTLPSLKSRLQGSFLSVCADWRDLILKLASLHLRWWSIHIFVCWLIYRTGWKSCADWTGWHLFCCSEFLQCLLYNPVALPYAFPLSLSTPTTYLQSFVFDGSEVHDTSVCWGCIVSSFGVSSSGGAPGTLSMGKSVVDYLIDSHSGSSTEVEQWCLRLISVCMWYNPNK